MSKRKETPNVMGQLQGLSPPSTIPPQTEIEPEPAPASVPRPASPRSKKDKNKTPESRLIGRATYDIGQELKEAIRQESYDLGVPASQLAKYLLLYAWDFYINDEIPRPELLRSASPKFRNTIDFGE